MLLEDYFFSVCLHLFTQVRHDHLKAAKMLSWKVILPAFVIIAACLYSILKQSDEDRKRDTEQSIIWAWKSLIREPTKKFERISIG